MAERFVAEAEVGGKWWLGSERRSRREKSEWMEKVKRIKAGRKRVTADGMCGKGVVFEVGRKVGMALMDAAQRSIHHVMSRVTSLLHTLNYPLSFTFSLPSLFFVLHSCCFLFSFLTQQRCRFLDFVMLI